MDVLDLQQKQRILWEDACVTSEGLVRLRALTGEYGVKLTAHLHRHDSGIVTQSIRMSNPVYACQDVDALVDNMVALVVAISELSKEKVL